MGRSMGRSSIQSSPMTKLYEISQDIASLASKVPESVDDERELAEQFQGLQRSLEYKVEGIAKFLANLSAEETALSGEISRLEARRSKIQRATKWLRNYLKSNLEYLGLKSVETPMFKVTVAKSAKPSVRVVHTSDVPRDFITTSIEVKVDKGAILEHYRKTGEIPPGVEIEEGSYLRIT